MLMCTCVPVCSAVILTKSSKPIPVMLIGIIFYRKTYPWYKHVGTLLLCGGIVAFSYWKQSSHSSSSNSGNSSVDDANEPDNGYSLLIGILLVVMNLSLDGKSYLKFSDLLILCLHIVNASVVIAVICTACRIHEQ